MRSNSGWVRWSQSMAVVYPFSSSTIAKPKPCSHAATTEQPFHEIERRAGNGQRAGLNSEATRTDVSWGHVITTP
jgi:hypothetical protein